MTCGRGGWQPTGPADGKCTSATGVSGSAGRRCVAGALALLGAALLAVAPAPATEAQPPPTPAGTPPATAGPPPSIAGEWSITRTWYRRCPACASPVIRTTRWVVTQTGQSVAVDRGPRGTITGAPGGGGYLALSGPETGGFDVQRFWYGTLRVDPSGSSFDGSFGGSETIQNPCGSSPPMVTCLVSAGWLRAVRVRSTGPALPGPPGPLPATPSPTVRGTSTPTPTATASGPGPTPTATPTGPATGTASPTPHPLARLFFPAAAADR